MAPTDRSIHGTDRRQGRVPSSPSSTSGLQARAPLRCGGVHARLHRGLPRPPRARPLAPPQPHRHLQDHVFTLEEDLHAAARRIDHLRRDSTMNAEGIRCCVEEKEAMESCGRDEEEVGEEDGSSSGFRLTCPRRSASPSSSTMRRDVFADGQNELIVASTEMLYGLIHARYILTTKGLASMLEMSRTAILEGAPVYPALVSPVFQRGSP